MKKVVVLLVVLAIGGISFGTAIQPQQDVTGLTSVSVSSGGSVTIDLNWLAGSITPGKLTEADILITTSQSGTFNVAGVTTASAFDEINYIGPANAQSASYPASATYVSITSTGTGLSSGNIAVTGIVLSGITKSTVVTATFEADVQGLSAADFATLLDATNAPGTAGYPSSMNITVTPEPATMAILGLGALLLRRKKA